MERTAWRVSCLFVALAAGCFTPAALSHYPGVVTGVEQAQPAQAKQRVPGRCNAVGFPRRFDSLIRRAWIKHGKAEWATRHCGFRAQICKESSCGARGVDVTSHADGVGLGQLITDAAKDCWKAGFVGKRVNPRFNLPCSAWVMKRNGRIFSSDRTEECRIPIARACYVSGCGHLIRAQKLARADGKPAVCLDDGMLEYAEKVLSPSSYRDLVDYVESIEKLEKEMTP